jgi:site-specific DNA-methyltransferase (adenine-specific)
MLASTTPSDPWIAFEVANVMRNYFVLQNPIIWTKSISIENLNTGNNLINSNNGEKKIISKGHFNNMPSQRYLNNLFENIFHFTHSGNVKLDKKADGFAVPYQDKSNIGRYTDQDKRDRGNVWFIPYKTIQSKDERPHPAVFPEELPYYCIKLHGYDSNTIVYDPFMGSGTTALTCINLKVNYLGTEINKEYVQRAEYIINKRNNLKKGYSKQRSLENYL